MKSIIIISGEKGSGKTTFLIDVLNLLQMDGFVLGGFVSLHRLESDTYLIRNITTLEESLLLQRVASFDKRPNHFKFFPEGVEIGGFWIEEILKQNPDIAIVDEIGGFELSGKLWSNGFTAIVNSTTPLIFTVKTKYLDEVMKKWNINPALIFDSADFGNPQKAFEKIKELFRSN